MIIFQWGIREMQWLDFGTCIIPSRYNLVVDVAIQDELIRNVDMGTESDEF